MLWITVAWGATFYVEPSCPVNGDGTVQDCAVADGGPGAWSTLGPACGGPDDHVQLRGETYALGGSWTLPDRCSGKPGHPLVVENYPQENAVLDGRLDIKDRTWENKGSGVWACDDCAPATGFPLAAWMLRKPQGTEAVVYLHPDEPCDAALPGTMCVDGSGRMRVHPADGLSPADSVYFEVPQTDVGLSIGGAHDVVVRTNPVGGSLRWVGLARDGIDVGPNAARITLQGLDVGYVSGRCVDLAAPSSVVAGNHLHHCGQIGVRLAAAGEVSANEIDDIQAPGWFGTCAPCSVPNFDDRCAGIRLDDVSGVAVVGNRLHDDCGGRDGSGVELLVSGSGQNVLFDGNFSSQTSPGGGVAWAMTGAGPFDGITWRNNRASSVDACLAIGLTEPGSVSVDLVSDTCAEFRRSALVVLDGDARISGSVTFTDDLWVAESEDPESAFDAGIWSGSPGIRLPVTNAFYCPKCTASLIRWTDGATYDPGTLSQFGQANVEGDPALDFETLTLLGPGGSAFRRGTAIDPAFPDFEGDPRPTGLPWDIGADQLPTPVVDTGLPETPTPTDPHHPHGGQRANPCGCASTGAGSGWAIALVSGAAWLRRRPGSARLRRR